MSSPEVITVFQCECGRFLPSPEGLDNHLQVCSKLEQEEGTSSRDEPNFSEDVNGGGGGVKRVEFYSPQVIVTRLSETEIKAAQGQEAQESESGPQCDNDTSNDKERRKLGSVVLRKVKVKVPDQDQSNYASLSSTPTPRRSSLRAMQKLQDISKSLRRTGPSLNISDAELKDKEYKLTDEDWEEEDDEDDKRSKRSRPKTSSLKRARKRKRESLEMDGFGNLADDQYPYKCSKCPTKFQAEEKFKWHMFNIHGDGSKNHEILTCPLCGRMINRRLVFLSHLKNHENAEAVEDAFDLWNKWPEKRLTESKASKMSLKFNCKYCLIPHTSHYSFLTHMKMEHPLKGRFSKYTCQYCETSEFDSMKLYILHIRTTHQKEYYGETMKWSLANPLKQEGRPKGQCDICKKMLDVWYLRDHKEKVHFKKKVGVQVQGKKDTLEDEDGRLSCPMPECHSKFKNRSLLKMHFILHLENNPYSCPFPGCTVKCDAQCHLNRHIKLHKSEFLTCKKCGVSYSRIDKLKNHVCCFDPSKLKYDENGLLRPIKSNSRLNRVHDAVHGAADQLQGNSKEICNIKNELESDHDDMTDSRVGGKTEKTRYSSETKIYTKRININSIIMSDPVFIKVCEKNPEFKELIFGTVGVGTWNGTTKHSPKIYRCTACFTGFYERKALQKHNELCKPEDEKIKIEKDADSGSSSREISSSTTSTKALEKVGCPICAASFENSNILDCHVESDHEPRQVFRCSTCKIIFSTKRIKEHHVQIYHLSSPFKCPKCLRGFSTKRSMNQHSEGCEDVKTKCSKCDKILVNPSSLARHWLLIHGTKLKPVPKASPKKTNNHVKRVASKRKKKGAVTKSKGNHAYPTKPPSKKGNHSPAELDYSNVKIETEPEVTFTIDNDDIQHDINSYSEVPENYIKTEPVE